MVARNELIACRAERIWGALACMLVTVTVVCPLCVACLPTPLNKSGRLVMASACFCRVGKRVNRGHEFEIKAMVRAMIWQRFRSCVVKPLQPHWFFSSSKFLSASALYSGGLRVLTDQVCQQ